MSLRVVSFLTTLLHQNLSYLRRFRTWILPSLLLLYPWPSASSNDATHLPPGRWICHWSFHEIHCPDTPSFFSQHSTCCISHQQFPLHRNGVLNSNFLLSASDRYQGMVIRTSRLSSWQINRSSSRSSLTLLAFSSFDKQRKLYIS